MPVSELTPYQGVQTSYASLLTPYQCVQTSYASLLRVHLCSRITWGIYPVYVCVQCTVQNMSCTAFTDYLPLHICMRISVSVNVQCTVAMLFIFCWSWMPPSVFCKCCGQVGSSADVALANGSLAVPMCRLRPWLDGGRPLSRSPFQSWAPPSCAHLLMSSKKEERNLYCIEICDLPVNRLTKINNYILFVYTIMWTYTIMWSYNYWCNYLK